MRTRDIEHSDCVCIFLDAGRGIQPAAERQVLSDSKFDATRKRYFTQTNRKNFL